MEMTAKELKSQVGATLTCVERGEALTIIYRGKSAARMVATDEDAAEPSAAKMPAFGMCRGQQDLADVGAHVHALQRGRPLAG